MRRVAELVRGRLVDRDGTRTGGRIGLLTGMDLTGFETPLLAHLNSLWSRVGTETHARFARAAAPINEL
jgi:hypothetical protein